MKVSQTFKIIWKVEERKAEYQTRNFPCRIFLNMHYPEPQECGAGWTVTFLTVLHPRLHAGCLFTVEWAKRGKDKCAGGCLKPLLTAQ